MSNEFDNEESSLYIYAVQNKVPISQVLSKRRDDGVLYFEQIRDLYRPEISLEEFLETIPEEQLLKGLFVYIQKVGITSELVAEINDWFREHYNLTKNQYDSIEELQLAYRNFENDVQKELVRNQEKYNEIKEYQTILSSYPQAQLLSERITERTLYIAAYFEEDDPSFVLEHANVSLSAPVMVYRNRNEARGFQRPYMDQYIADLTSESNEEQIFTKVIDQTTTFPHSILPLKTKMMLSSGYYLQVYKNEDEPTGLYSPDNYITVPIDPTNKSLKFNVSQQVEPLIIERIKRALPHLKLTGSQYEINIKATFDIVMPPNFSIYLFAYITNLEPVISYYINIDENGRLIPFNRRYTLKFGQTMTIGFARRYPDTGKPYLHFTVSQVPNSRILKSIEKIMARIIGSYEDLINFQEPGSNLNRSEIHKALFPSLFETKDDESDDVDDKASTISTLAGGSKIKELQRRAPEVFVTEYGKRCQKERQPVMIDESEIDEYNEVLAFPPSDPKYYFVCPYKDYPYPGIQRNRTKNRNEFPYLPCCFMDSQMDPNKRSLYNQVYEDTEYEVKEKKHVRKKLTNIHAFGLGLPPNKLNTMLKSKVPYGDFTYYRMGAPLSPSSVLHLLLDAFDDTNYLKLPIDEREEYVEEFRETFSRLNLSVAKQEMWNLSEPEVRDRINEMDSFFDPLLYHRLIEERFRINLFTITYDKDGNYELAVPYHRSFYAWTRREYRPSVVIFRNALEDEVQCELLVCVDPRKEKGYKIFGHRMTRVLNDLFKECHQTVEWNFDSENKTVGHRNIYSIIDWFNIVKDQVEGMLLDSYGKMRGLNLINGISVLFPPAQPENFPVVQKYHISTSDRVIASFGQPTSKTEEGLWFRILDIPEGVFIPCSTEGVQVPSGTPNPFGEGTRLTHTSLHQLRKVANIIIQILRYLYDLYRVEKGTLSGFINLIDVRDVNYDLSTLGSKIPVGNFKSALEYFSQKTNFVQHNRIIAYSDKFKERLVYYVKKYQHDTAGLIPKPQPYISFATNEEDFTSDGSRVFLSEQKLELWIAAKKRVYSDVKVYKKILFNLAQAEEPYVYNSNSNDKWYLIQNSYHKLAGALEIARIWNEKRYNPGYRTEPSTDSYSYVLYTIATDGGLAPVADHRKGDVKPFIILTYNSQNTDSFHAALLPLL